MRKLFVRADGNATIGIGHLMRTMAVTECLKEDMEILFLCAMEESASFVRSKGYRAIALNTELESMEAELPFLEEFFSGEVQRGILLADSYCVTDHYLKALSQHCFVILFDDLGEHRYPVDGLINYHCYVDRDWYGQNYGTELTLLGPSFVPLRREFGGARAKNASRRTRHVLLTTGGGDSTNIGGKILERIYREDMVFHWILGPFSPNFSWAQEFSKDKPGVMLEKNVVNMAELMAECDLCITAGGSTVYELCAMEVPMIVFSYARNQEKLTAFIGENKCGLYAGAFDKAPDECLNLIEEQFHRLRKESDLRKALADRAKSLVDGKGSDRIAREIRKLQIV